MRHFKGAAIVYNQENLISDWEKEKVLCPTDVLLLSGATDGVADTTDVAELLCQEGAVLMRELTVHTVRISRHHSQASA